MDPGSANSVGGRRPSWPSGMTAGVIGSSESHIHERRVLAHPFPVTHDAARLDRIAAVVIDALVGESFRPDRGEPGTDPEADAQLNDLLRVVVHVLMLPHRRRH